MPNPLGFDVVLFMLGMSRTAARMKAKAICRNTICSTPTLAQWQVAG